MSKCINKCYFYGCPGPEGPPGKDGPDGNPGSPGSGAISELYTAAFSEIIDSKIFMIEVSSSSSDMTYSNGVITLAPGTYLVDFFLHFYDNSTQSVITFNSSFKAPVALKLLNIPEPSAMTGTYGVTEYKEVMTIPSGGGQIYLNVFFQSQFEINGGHIFIIKLF